MVLLGHAGWPLSGNRAHELGVELFFVLSGFLITALLLEEHARAGRVDLVRFYARRARRLVPALVAVVVACLIVASRTNLLDWGGTRRGAIGGLTYSSDIVRVNGWDLGPLGHLWSLAVEEHFYMVWPLLLLAAFAVVNRWSARWVLLALPLALAAACFAWRGWLVARGSGDALNTRLYYPTDTRVLGPLVGCALAVVTVGRGATWRGPWPQRLGLIGLAVLLWLSTGPAITDRPTMFVAGLPLASLAAIGICAACVTPPNLVQRLLEQPVLRWLGSISYGGYLVHYPIYFAFGFELTQMSTWQTVQVIAVSLLAGVAVERFVERPFRHRQVPSAVAESTATTGPVCVDALAR